MSAATITDPELAWVLASRHEELDAYRRMYHTKFPPPETPADDEEAES